MLRKLLLEISAKLSSCHCEERPKGATKQSKIPNSTTNFKILDCFVVSKRTPRNDTMIALQISLSLIFSLFLFAQTLHAQSKNYWIEFTDKGITAENFTKGNAQYEKTHTLFTPDALKRRATLVSSGDLTDIISIDDAAPCPHYLSALSTHGIHAKNISRWCNAISAHLNEEQLIFAKTLPFVKKVSPVLQGRTSTIEEDERELRFDVFLYKLPTRQELPQAIPIPPAYDSIIFHYGGSASQLERTNVRPLHAMGFDGSNVKLGFLDVGFRWKAMRTTKDRNIKAEYDFVFGDSVTANEANDVPDQDGHGSIVLSAAIGYLSDSVVGAAYNADIYLAKTEDLRSETPREEDNYAAALEWMEAKGIDITSSSLGYFTYDSGFTSITYNDLDGKTTISVRAAARAARLGVLVITAMGNSGKTVQSHLITPADADNIISVGAMNVNDTIADFSSKGPSSDGRIKPEICAPGVAVWTMGPDDVQKAASGTSLATPLVSAACALIKQAHPEASAQAIRTAVMNTGRRTGPIDTVYGYGRLDAYNAALSLGTIISPHREWRVDSIHSVTVGIAANNGVVSPRVIYSIDSGAFTNIISLQLATDSLIYAATFPVLRRGALVQYYFETSDGADTLTHMPRFKFNMPDSVFHFYVGDTIIKSPFAVGDVNSLDNITITPNPASDHFIVERVCNPFTGGRVTNLTYYSLVNMLGDEVLKFSTNEYSSSIRVTLGSLPAGAYFLRGFSANKKLIIQRHIIVTR